MMNVFYSGQLFFKKESIKQASVIQSHPHEEVIAYCITVRKKFIQCA